MSMITESSPPPKEVMDRFRARGISFAVDAEELVIRAPKGALTADDIAKLSCYKSALMTMLTTSPEAESKPPAASAKEIAEAVEANKKAYSERADIQEFDGDMCRADAQAEAAQSTRFRVWRLTLTDGSQCTMIDPDGATLETIRLVVARSFIGHRVVASEPIVAPEKREKSA